MTRNKLSLSRRREDIRAWWTEHLAAQRKSWRSQAAYCLVDARASGVPRIRQRRAARHLNHGLPAGCLRPLPLTAECRLPDFPG